MKSKYARITLFLIGVAFVLLMIFGGIDINSAKAVIQNMQGNWHGSDHEGGMYTHYKLNINGSSFKGWVQPSSTNDDPNFSSSPDVEGTFTLSPVQGYTNSSGKYRNINFSMLGGGFGDNSLEARSLTKMIVFDQSNGLSIAGWGGMERQGWPSWNMWPFILGVCLAILFEVKVRLSGKNMLQSNETVKTKPTPSRIKSKALFIEKSHRIGHKPKRKLLLASSMALIVAVIGSVVYNNYVTNELNEQIQTADSRPKIQAPAKLPQEIAMERVIESDNELKNDKRHSVIQTNGQTETISKNEYSIFENDNISIDSLEFKIQKFNANSGLTQYSQYSKHTYSLSYDAPTIDLNRSWEPSDITTGIQRKYFKGTESVAIQLFIRNSKVESEIHLHPNGEIFTIKNLFDGKPDGYCKYVDLDKYIILEGNYKVGKMVGIWNNPIMGNFDMSNHQLRNEYVGIVDKTICLIKWYQLSKENRVEYMK